MGTMEFVPASGLMICSFAWALCRGKELAGRSAFVAESFAVAAVLVSNLAQVGADNSRCSLRCVALSPFALLLGLRIEIGEPTVVPSNVNMESLGETLPCQSLKTQQQIPPLFVLHPRVRLLQLIRVRKTSALSIHPEPPSDVRIRND